ncbi:hypothetical protein J4E89_011105 [Alternaria sp. Ai002NY15]|nr:hypothetical protein J4E89_011105 [Alternaria sp. Ai002NY15]
MPDGRERQPYLSKGWRKQLDPYESGHMRSTSEFPRRYCFYFCWPDKDSITTDDWKAGRVGYLCDPQWAHTIYPYLFDGDWHGDGASLQPVGENTEQIQAQLAKERPKFIKKNGPPIGGGMAREWYDNVRILSFWVTGGPDDKGPRTVDPTGLDPNGKIQLKLLIAAKMYAKRTAWDKTDYKGKNITREEIGLPKPVQVVDGTPPDEIKKIELLLDSLAAGLPEVSVHGRRTWVDPPSEDQEKVGDLAAFIRGG